VDSIDRFQEVLDLINRIVGKHRSFFYRHEQKCGFVNFFDEEAAANAIQRLNGHIFNGGLLKAALPLHYFGNEEDAKPSNRKPEKSSRTLSPPTLHGQIENSTTDSMAQVFNPPQFDVAPKLITFASSQTITVPNFIPYSSPKVVDTTPSDSDPGALVANAEPSSTLVLKNLAFNLKQERLLAALTQANIEPQSVNYQYGSTGTFRGVAFAKYMKLEDAIRAFERLSRMEIEGRSVRVEYKRRSDIQLPSNLHEDEVFDLEPNGTFHLMAGFKENPFMKEIAFVDALTMNQRSQIHMLAERLGLNHTTTGTAEVRYVIVSKPSGDSSVVLTNPNPPTHPIPRPPHRTVSIQESIIPRVPDGTKGFGMGRGRRSSTPHPILKHGPSPLQNSSRSVSVPTFPQRSSLKPSPTE
jgi:RNA recognition motif-containing protein